MIRLTTPMLVMVLTFCKGDKNGRGNHPTWLARQLPDTPYVSLWHTLPEKDETPEEAALRCLHDELWNAEHILQPHDLLDVGDNLSDTHRLKLFCVPWLMPQPMLRLDNAALVRLGTGHPLPAMDKHTRLALETAPLPLRKRIHLRPNGTPVQHPFH